MFSFNIAVTPRVTLACQKYHCTHKITYQIQSLAAADHAEFERANVSYLECLY